MRPAKRLERQYITAGRADAARRQADCCKYCFEPFNVSAATADHRQARNKGGSNLSHNIDAVCASCNLLKGSMTPGAFAKIIKRPPPGSELGLLMAWSRRRLWLATHRACRNILRAVGRPDIGPLAA